MITIFTLCYNEQVMLPHFVSHYRSMFENPHIVIYDNVSTDSSVSIAKELGCEVRTFITGNTLSDRTYLQIKNACWKQAQTKWVLVCDMDEFCFVTDYDLSQEERDHVSIIKFKAYNMVNDKDDFNIPEIKKGVRSLSYDKLYCFDRTKIQEINYAYGSHKANPTGQVKYSRTDYNCRHYKYLNLPYMINRHAIFAKRLSDHNRKLGLGGHYLYTAEEITKEFNEARLKAVVI
jgi:hypothetical protein